MSKILVTISPPTPNGGLHLGHLAGPFLSADVFARTQKLLGNDVVLLSYSDDYQSYLSRKARELREDEETTCARFSMEIEATLARSEIHLDHFLHARNNKTFIAAVSRYLTLLDDQGLLKKERQSVPYCQHCDLFGYEAFARGKCDNCGNPSDASQCEVCASAPDAKAMDSLVCTQCQKPMGWRDEEPYVFNLGHFRLYLKEYYEGVTKRPQLTEFLERNLAKDTLDWPVTRPGESGIRVPWQGGQIAHTWFSGLAGYRAAFEEYAQKVGRPELVGEYWHDPDTIFAHFLGFDCSFSHTLVYRAILSVTETPPETVHYYTNAFLELNGKDFSTSRGHAIWVNEALDRVSADTLRLYLAALAPENARRNFITEDFDGWWPAYEEESCHLLSAMAVAKTEFAEEDFTTLELLKRRWLTHASPDKFSMCGMAKVLLDLWQLIQNARRTKKNVNLLASAYATMAAPLQPNLSLRLFEQSELSPITLRGWLRGEFDDLIDAMQYGGALETKGR